MEHMSSPVRLRSNKEKEGSLTVEQRRTDWQMQQHYGQMRRVLPLQSSTLSIEDQEDTQLPYAMRDLPPAPRPGEQTPDRQTPVNDRELEGSGMGTTAKLPSCPGTPLQPRSLSRSPAGSPVAPPRPHRAATENQFQPLSLRRQLATQGSLDSPLSPSSRPQSPWGRFDPYDSPEDQDKEYVGFATLPNQVHRKTVKKGFTFTLIVAGESGLGKSTLINSLFLTDLYKDRKVPNAEERISQTVTITTHSIGIEEKGVKLRLTIVDTPGFGDAVNNTESWKEIEDYIDRQFEQYFRDESGLNRKNIQDNRVHCCLYFISPFGHGLRPLDVECMKALHEKVNIIPVLAKADSLTPAEVCRKKMKIKEEIKQFGISIYQFPDCDSDEDEAFKKQDQILKDSIPFAVIGSNLQVESKGRKFRGRLYPWGMVEVENPAHSDFLLLRNMLMRTHMQDLKDVTRETHYENYRAQCIQSMTRMVVQEKKRSIRDKIRQESRTDFPLPLAAIDTEKERLILEKDEEVYLTQRLGHFIYLFIFSLINNLHTSLITLSPPLQLRKMQEVLERIQEQMQNSQKGDF
ncbi:septin 4a isoform X2 [Myripristis murdjan]|uniref:septin 4a isoform X2 n=1 Tax=Myripristis murdjan TaxID=586833 RepID=UPI0011761C45|nr:septin-5-like isoform X2 [Myripristis murdjan]